MMAMIMANDTAPLHGDDHNDNHLDESLMTIMVISFL